MVEIIASQEIPNQVITSYNCEFSCDLDLSALPSDFLTQRNWFRIDYAGETIARVSPERVKFTKDAHAGFAHCQITLTQEEQEKYYAVKREIIARDPYNFSGWRLYKDPEEGDEE